ncbi:MAG: Lrp/AsnC ligand binding domain-containing protein [Thermoprotei archaeon]
MGGVKAYILVTTSIGLEYDIAEEIMKLENENVRVSVDVVFGEYDLVVTAEGKDLKDVDRLVTNVRRISGVTRTLTLISSRG